MKEPVPTTDLEAPEHCALRLPIMSLAAEYLVMGHLMRRNVLAYKAPPGNEGYDLICIHPDPRHKPAQGQLAQVRVQVKSRYQTDCNRAVLVKGVSLDAFEFLVVAFLNTGKFYGSHNGSDGDEPPEFYTFTQDYVRTHHVSGKGWDKLPLRAIRDEIQQYRDARGFEMIAEALGVPRPTKVRKTE